MKKRFMSIMLAGVLLCSTSLPVKAVSNQKNSDIDAVEAVDILEDAVEVELPVESVEKEENDYVVETDEQTVVVNEENEIEIMAENENGEMLELGENISLDGENVTTTVVDDIIVMDDEDNDCLITTEIFDGGIRNSIIIEEGCSEEGFPIELSLPEGAHIEFARNEYEGNEMDGSLQIVNEHNEIIGAIDIPWAKDAVGNDVETYYKIEGSTVIQYVKHKDMENIQYPIVADPMLTFGSCFSSGKWITRNGVVSLSLKPRSSLRRAMLQGSSSMKNYSWQTVYNKFHSSSKWKNTTSMKNQYYCHWYFAMYKSNFNLEPSRKTVSWAKMIKKMCNP